MKLLPLILFCLVVACWLPNHLQSQDTCFADLEPPHCFQITCGFRTPLLYPNNTACHACTRQDIGSRFTQCDENGFKKLIYFWKPPATCLATGSVFRLPNPIVNIPCDLECSSKEFLNASTKECVSCPSGHVSLQSRYIVESWKKLPDQMSTYCTATNPANACNAWRLRDGTIDSGSNAMFSNLNSTLSLSLEISTEGSISFEYQFTSDFEGARFYFLANGQELAALDTTSGDFNWQIRKQNEYSFQNLAILKSIQVRGLASASSFCEPCPLGTYTNDKLLTCVPCPRNTYSNITGATECISCPEFTISESGSSECVFDPKSICTGKDYYAYYGPCNPISQKQQIVYKWIEPRICNPTHPNSIALPFLGEIDCDVNKKCKVGQANRNGNCVYCEKGYYATEDGCDICLDGYGTQNIYYVDRFTNDTQSDFYAFCRGDCATRRGWRFAGDYADTGYSNGIATMALVLQLRSFTYNPVISIIYQMSCTEGNLLFAAGGTILQTIPCSKCDTSLYNATFDLSSFAQTASSRTFGTAFSVVFQKISAENSDCNIVKVHNMTIQGTTMGGSSTCQICPAGTFANEVGNCDPCPAGTFASTSGSFNCTLCNRNTYSQAGASKCTPCGRGMTSTLGSSNCTFLYGTCSLVQNVRQIPRIFNWRQTALQLSYNGFIIPTDGYTPPYPSTVTDIPQAVMPPVMMQRMYFNLEGKSNHPPCKNSIVCKQSRWFDVISLGDDMDLRGIYTDTTIGVRISSQSFTKNCYAPTASDPYNTTLIHSKTIITLLCDPTATTSISQQALIESMDSYGCQYKVTIYTSEVCPSCLEQDWFLYRGDCIDGQRQVYYSKKSESFHTCVGGVQYSNQTVSTQTCSTAVVQMEAPYWVIGVVLGVVALIVLLSLTILICSIILCVKYRKLHHKYYQLLKEERTVSVSGVERGLNSLRLSNTNNNAAVIDTQSVA